MRFVTQVDHPALACESQQNGLNRTMVIRGNDIRGFSTCFQIFLSTLVFVSDSEIYVSWASWWLLNQETSVFFVTEFRPDPRLFLSCSKMVISRRQRGKLTIKHRPGGESLDEDHSTDLRSRGPCMALSRLRRFLYPDAKGSYQRLFFDVTRHGKYCQTWP